MLEQVFFQVDDQRVVATYDRSQLRLGCTVHVAAAPNGEFEFSSTPTRGSEPYEVLWIAPSEWWVNLSKGWVLPPRHIDAVTEALDGYTTRDQVELALGVVAKDIRWGRGYLTTEYTRSRVNQFVATAQRLDMVAQISRLQAIEVLGLHRDGLRVYLLLTCFDTLGQPASWMPFDEWVLRSSDGTKAGDNDQRTEAARLYREWQSTHGVRNSFHNFVDTILPAFAVNELLDSLTINISDLPPGPNGREATNSEKLRYLFELRNRYTHRAEFLMGWPSELPAQEAASYMIREQSVGMHDWRSVMTRNWPGILERTVKIGFARMIASLAQSEK